MLTQRKIDQPKWEYRCPSCGYRSDMDMLFADSNRREFKPELLEEEKWIWSDFRLPVFWLLYGVGIMLLITWIVGVFSDG